MEILQQLLTALTALVMALSAQVANLSNVVSPASQLAQVAAPTSGLVGYWNFDEGSGTAVADASGSGNNGALIGAPAWVAGKVGAGALQFDGSSQYATVPNNASLQLSGQMTVSVWAKQDSALSAPMAGKWTSGSQESWLLRARPDGTVWVNIAPTLTDLYTTVAKTSAGSWTTGAWHHVAIVYNGAGSGNAGKLQLYIDGIPQTLAFTGTIPNSLLNANAPVNFGTGNGYWNGSLDEGRIYNRVLSASEISDIYNDAGGTPPPPPPPPSDTTAPSVPTGLTATAISSSQINLTWTASTDNVGVAGYRIYRGGTQIGTSAANSYSDTGLTAATAYTYTVSAYDAAGNASAQSSSASATTQAVPPAGGLTVTTSQNNSSIPLYDIYELTMAHATSYPNNWEDVNITATFSAPGGNTYTVGGFYYDTNTWKLRFAPRQTGTHTWTLTFTSPNGTYTGSGSFTATASSQSGFLRINPNNKYQLYTEGNNKYFYPIGFNDLPGEQNTPGILGWCLGTDPTPGCDYTSDQYFGAYALQGKNNFFRWNGQGRLQLWMTGQVNVNGTGKNVYDKGHGKLGDEMAQKLHQYGMKYQLAFLADPTLLLPSWDMTNTARWASLTSLHKYVINRWGAYADIWELMNEKSGVPSAYYSAITNYVRSLDPYQHPITTSYTTGGIVPNIEIVSPHNYLNVVNTGVASSLTTYIKGLKPTYSNQPMVMGEIGNQSPITNYDPERYRFLSWVSFANEASAIFWNTSYAKNPYTNGLTNMYIGTEERAMSTILSNFIADFDPLARPISVTSASTVKAYGIGSNNDIIVYVIGASTVTTPISGATVTLTVPQSSMSAYWMNPKTGATVQAFAPGSGSQTLTIPAFTADLVLRIKSGGAPPPPPPSDTTAPSVPTGLTATAISSSQINLTWTAATDNVGVAGYRIYRGGTQIGTSAANSYSDTGLTAATAYTYTVSAYDAAGNASAQSSSASATTQPISNPLSTKFTAGQRVQTTSNLNVRATASATGTLLGTQSLGALGTIVSGGQSADGYYWWNVDYDSGVDGYSIEDYLIAYAAVPPPPTSGSCTPAGNGISIKDLTGSVQSNHPFSISRVFKQGDIANYPQARVNGTATLTQADVKTRWPDGSVQHSIVSFIASLPAGGCAAVDFVNQGTGNNTGELGQLGMLNFNGGAWGAKIETSIGSADARTMLQNLGLSADINSNQIRYWLRGPIVTQVIVEDKSTSLAYDFGSDAYKVLHPIFVLTFYPGSSGVKVDYILENMWSTKREDQTYNLTLKAGNPLSSALYSKTGFTQYSQTRWKKTYWSGADLDADASGNMKYNVDYNRTYMIDSRILPNYDLAKIPSVSAISGAVSAFNATDKGDLGGRAQYVLDFGTTGGRPELGLTTTWEAQYLATFDPGLYKVVLGNAAVSGYVPIHSRESNTALTQYFGKPYSIDAHPSGGGTVDVGTRGASGWKPDLQHMSSFGFVPYLITGDWYYLEELQFWTGHVFSMADPGTCSYCRNGAMGIITQPAAERGFAWGLRSLAHAAFFTPDADSFKQYQRSKLDNTLGAYEGKLNITDGAYYNTPQWTFGHDVIAPNGNGGQNGKLPDPLGFIMYSSNCIPSASDPYGMDSTVSNYCTSNYMNHYLRNSLGYVSEMGYPADKLLRESSKELIEIVLNPSSSPYLAATYNNPRIDKNKLWFQNWNTYFTGYTSTQKAKTPWNVISPSSDDSNADNGYPHLARAAASFATQVGSQSGTGQSAYNWLNTNMNTSVLSNNPKWAFVPRIAGSVTPPPPPPVTLPVISNLVGSNTTATTTQISWDTNILTNGRVFYGLTSSYGLSSALLDDAVKTYSHAVTLSSLSPATTYHFKATSVDALGNSVSSPDFTFTTAADLPPADTTPPAISAVISSGITASAAAISWTTNEAADTQVEYGTTVLYGQSTPLNTSLTTSHSAALSGLGASTLYHYRVKSKDTAGNLAISGDYTFTTSAVALPSDTVPPAISNIQTLTGATSATVTWSTDEAADTQLEYGLTQSYGLSSALNPLLSTAHSVKLTGLTKKATYHFRVKSKDAALNLAVSPDYTLTLSSRSNKPPKVSDLSASNGSVVLSWTNPLDYEYFAKAAIYKSTASYVNNPNSSSLLSLTASQRFTDTSVNAGSTYYYSVFAVDDLGAYSDPAMVSFTPAATGKGSSATVYIPAASSSGKTGEQTKQTACPMSDAALPALTRNLYRSVKGEEVLTLQNFLVSQGFLAADANTGFFGSLTEKAVQAFQKASGLVSSGNPLSTGYGFVGPMTRAKINASRSGSACPSAQSVLGSSTQALQEQIKLLQEQVNRLLLQLQKLQ